MKAVGTVVGIVLIAIALLAIAGFIYYTISSTTELYNRLAEIAGTKASAATLASGVTGWWLQTGDTLTIHLENGLPNAVKITTITILWTDGSYTVYDRHDTPSDSLSAEIRDQQGNLVYQGNPQLPIALGVSWTVDITINTAGKDADRVYITLSSSPVVAVVPLKNYYELYPPATGNATAPQQPGYSLLALPEPLTGLTVAEKGINYILGSPRTIGPISVTIINGTIAGGSVDNLAARDGQLLIVNPDTGPLCPGTDGWSYVRRITIYNPNNYSYNDIQARIELNNTNFDFTKANSDGSDLRFYLADCTPLYYWVETWDPNNQYAVIWVKIPHIEANSTVDIYMFYGNPDASWDTEHEGLTKIITPLPASDGPGYTIQYMYHFEDNPDGALNVGTPQGWQADDGHWPLNLPYQIPFYNTTLTSVYVSSNGFITTNEAIADEYQDDTNVLVNNLMIAPLWEDLTTQNGDIRVGTYSDTYGDAVVIRWDAQFIRLIRGIPIPTGNANFSLALYTNGIIRFDYGNIDRGNNGGNDGIATVGVSLGDGAHATAGSIPVEDLSYLRLILWPMKYTELGYLNGSVGPEELNQFNIVDVVFSYGDLGLARLDALSIYAQQPSGPSYTYTLVLYSGNAVLYSETNTTDQALDKNVSLEVFSSGPVEARIRIVSTSGFQLQLDLLALTYRSVSVSSSTIYIASNSTSKVYVFDAATNTTRSVSASISTASGCIAVAPATSGQGFWLVNGTQAAFYNTTIDAWTVSIDVAASAAPGCIAAEYNGLLAYVPGGSSTLHVYNASTGEEVAAYTLPAAIDEWAAAARAGSVLYVHTGSSNHLVAVNLATGQVTDLGQTPTIYPVGMDYDEASGKIVVFERGGGVLVYDTATGQWSHVTITLPYYPLEPGDRLALVSGRLYHVRGDGTSEVLVMNADAVTG